MTRDGIERRLRTEADPDADGYQPRPLPASAGDAGAMLRASGRARRPVARALVAGAAMVAALAIAATVLTGPGQDGGLGSGDDRSASEAPSAAGSSPATPAACRAADFAVASDPWGGAAGSRGTRVVFRVVASVASCAIEGSAAARITDAAGHVLVESAPDPGATRIVMAGDQLEIGVAWSNWCGPAPEPPLELEVMLAGDTTAIPLMPPDGTEIPAPPCMGAGQASNLSVTGFEPSERPPIEG